MTEALRTTEDLGRAIRRRRKELGLTQQDVADTARASLRLVSELERGRRDVRVDSLLRVLTVLGIDLELRPR